MNRLLLIGMLLAWSVLCAACAQDLPQAPQHSAVATPAGTSPAPSASPTPPNAGALPQRWLVRCQEYLTLRTQPELGAPALQRLPNGQVVTLAGFEGLYAQVTLPDGRSGYVLSGYIEPEQPDPDLAALTVVQPVEEYPHAQMMADLAALQERYPQLLRVESAGTSLEGRDIPVAVVGDPGAQHHVLVQAGIHGREHMTSLLTMTQLEYILARPDAPFAGGTVRNWLEDVCLHLLPMTNPDGVQISQRAQATEPLRAIYQSDVAAGYAADLPLRTYLRQWKANAAGIDLNRNFDAQWVDLSGPAEPSFARYKGAAPADQPESQALVQYTQRYAFAATLSYHAYGSCIFWQFGQPSDANTQSEDLARALAATTQYPFIGADGLDAGGYKDWAVEQLGIPSVTVEIGTRECPLPLPEFAAIWRRNRDVLPTLARWARTR